MFIGVKLDRSRVLDLMESVLLTDIELAEGPQRWVDYTDPLPPPTVICTPTRYLRALS